MSLQQHIEINVNHYNDAMNDCRWDEREKCKNLEQKKNVYVRAEELYIKIYVIRCALFFLLSILLFLCFPLTPQCRLINVN